MVYRETIVTCVRCRCLLEEGEGEELATGRHCWRCARQTEVDEHLGKAEHAEGLGAGQRSWIADVVESGDHFLIGTVVAIERPLRSPLSATLCVGYWCDVSEAMVENQRQRLDARLVDFWLVDGTGRVRVDAASSWLAISPQHQRAAGFLEPALPDAIVTLLATQQVASSSLLGLRRELLFQEAVLAVDELIRLAGKVTVHRDDEGGITRTARGALQAV